MYASLAVQKFVSKFGKNLADGAEAILAKVTEVFQGIQDQRERVQG